MLRAIAVTVLCASFAALLAGCDLAAVAGAAPDAARMITAGAGVPAGTGTMDQIQLRLRDGTGENCIGDGTGTGGPAGGTQQQPRLQDGSCQ